MKSVVAINSGKCFITKYLPAEDRANLTLCLGQEVYARVSNCAGGSARPVQTSCHTALHMQEISGQSTTEHD